MVLVSGPDSGALAIAFKTLTLPEFFLYSLASSLFLIKSVKNAVSIALFHQRFPMLLILHLCTYPKVGLNAAHR